MITITNEKVAGFAPRWNQFRGFTLLFNNPNPRLNLSGTDGLRWIDCKIETDPKLQLYEALAKSLWAIGGDLLINTYLFCPLPPSSYHVTALGMVADDNANSSPLKNRGEIKDFVEELPTSFRRATKFKKIIATSSLVSSPHKINFRFDKLVIPTNADMLYSRLIADDDSRDAYQKFLEAREKLNLKFFGQSASKIPCHITLGYFANKESAEQAAAKLDTWNKKFKEEKNVGNRTITFDSISLYGFTDMASYFKS